MRTQLSESHGRQTIGDPAKTVLGQLFHSRASCFTAEVKRRRREGRSRRGRSRRRPGGTRTAHGRRIRCPQGRAHSPPLGWLRYDGLSAGRGRPSISRRYACSSRGSSSAPLRARSPRWAPGRSVCRGRRSPRARSPFAAVWSDLSRLADRAIVAVTGDHATPSTHGVLHTGEPTPLLVVGPTVRQDTVTEWGELPARQGWWGQVRADELLPLLLGQANDPSSSATGSPHDL